MSEKKLPKLDQDGPKYRQLAARLAFGYCPPIHPCKKCTHPVVDGYCCMFCGTGTPGTTEEQDAAFNAKHGIKE